MSSLPSKLTRYAAVATLFLKYGRSLANPTPDDQSDGDADPSENGDSAPEHLAQELEALGPTFVKLGQVLSSRPDVLPASYISALQRLQDGVAPFPFSDVQAIVEQELSARLSKAFASFDATPHAAASLGQVHRAVLRTGTTVAVKVQRPGVRHQVVEDLVALDEVARFLQTHTEAGQHYDVVGMVGEFRQAIMAELDYRQEADNLRLIGANLADFDQIVVPKPIDDYTSTRVLTMEYIAGTKVTAISPLGRLDLDTVALAETLVRAYLKQIVVDGVFHADPHPGNMLVTADGKLAILDLGMIGRLTPSMQEGLLKLLLAISEGRGEEAAEVAVTLGDKRPEFEDAAFRRAIATLVGRYGHESMAQFKIGRALIELTDVTRAHHMRPAAELTVLGKTLLHLDEVARALRPDLDVNEAIRRNSADLMAQRVRKAATSTSVFATVLEAKEFAEKFPGRVNRVLDALAASELTVKIEILDGGSIIGGLQKVANRITLGLILAALIVGAALIMRIETNFRILGYPALATMLLMTAAAGAAYLAVQILLHDTSPRRR